MKFEDLTEAQAEAISISLDCPSDRTLAEFLEESATDLTLTVVRRSCWIEVRTDDGGGEMTGMLTRTDGGWMMSWDGWTF